MAERDGFDLDVGGVDSTPSMMMRRWLSGEGAGEPDQYDTGLLQLVRHLGGEALSTLVDIGCNSGEFVVEGLRRVQAEAEHADPITSDLIRKARLDDTQIIGLDVLSEEVARYFTMGEELPHFTYKQVTDPTSLPIADESTDGATALNVLFRTDARNMVREIARILRPGGVAALSSNYYDHAHIRHDLTKKALGFATLVQQKAQIRSGQQLTETQHMEAPAKGTYFSDVRRFVRAAPSLIEVGRTIQTAEFNVTKDTFDEWVLAMELEASRTGLLPEFHHVYREQIRKRAFKRFKASDFELSDPIHRGVLVVRKTSP